MNLLTSERLHVDQRFPGQGKYRHGLPGLLTQPGLISRGGEYAACAAQLSENWADHRPRSQLAEWAAHVGHASTFYSFLADQKQALERCQ